MIAILRTHDDENLLLAKNLLVALARHRFAQLKKARKKFEKIQLWYKNQILHEGYVETTVGSTWYIEKKQSFFPPFHKFLSSNKSSPTTLLRRLFSDDSSPTTLLRRLSSNDGDIA
jgi:hypothetical protein